MLMFDREKFFNSVRTPLFNGSMSQQQVDGMNFKLAAWEANPRSVDLRFLAYPLATSYWETGRKMWPVEEIGKGKGRKYGIPDPETKQTYYGRGDVQLTWRENYSRATRKLGLTGGTDDLEWHSERALDPTISAEVMFSGMDEGWFTSKKLGDYFTITKNDPVNARLIINNDVSKMGKQIAGYHEKFLDALQVSFIEPLRPIEPTIPQVLVAISQPPGVEVLVTVNGKERT